MQGSTRGLSSPILLSRDEERFAVAAVVLKIREASPRVFATLKRDGASAARAPTRYV